jgi:hypothetical protein
VPGEIVKLPPDPNPGEHYIIGQRRPCLIPYCPGNYCWYFYDKACITVFVHSHPGPRRHRHFWQFGPTVLPRTVENDGLLLAMLEEAHRDIWDLSKGGY